MQWLLFLTGSTGRQTPADGRGGDLGDDQAKGLANQSLNAALGATDHRSSNRNTACHALGVVEALIALCVSPSAQGFTASELDRRVRLLSNQSETDYGPRRSAYELKKLRAKEIVRRIERRDVELRSQVSGFAR